MNFKKRIILATVLVAGACLLGTSYLHARGHWALAASAGILGLIALASLINLMIERDISSPLREFRRSMERIREGSMAERSSLQGHDEVFSLGEAFNNMLERLQGIHDEALSREREETHKKAVVDSREALENLNEQLTHKIKEVEAANNAVMSLSKELKSKNVDLVSMVRRLKSINEVGNSLASIIDQHQLLKLIGRTTAHTLNARTAQIHVAKVNHDPVTLKYVASNDSFSERLGVQELSQDFIELLSGSGRILENTEGLPEEPHTGKAIGVALKMRGMVVGAILLEERLDGTPYAEDDMELLGTLSNQAVVALENAWLYETVKSNYFGTIQSLVNALEASDRYTKGHSERVRFLVTELGKHMGLDYSEIEMLEHAAILHDIGKIGIDTEVLNKEDELTSTEFSLIRAHPIIGDEILGPIGTLKEVRTTILQHHERYDGRGYPYGIPGEEITKKARILAVVDTFDAMLTDRPYRKARSLEEVLDELRKGSGPQFDPEAVSSFLSMLEEKSDLLTGAGYSGISGTIHQPQK